ncbi:MAG: hypothetical protein ACTSWA_08660 [Candidatus Thorarchaeota archaeon]
MDTKDESPLVLKDCDPSTLKKHSGVEHLVFQGEFSSNLLDIIVQFHNLKSLSIAHTGSYRITGLVFFRLVPTLEKLQSLVIYETDYCLVHKTIPITESEIESIIETIKKPFYLIISGAYSKSIKVGNVSHPNLISIKEVFPGFEIIDDQNLREMSQKTSLELIPLFSPKIYQLKQPKVETLRIHIRDAWKRNLSFINSWNNLKRLEIYGNIEAPFFGTFIGGLQRDIDSGTIDFSWLDGNANIIEFVIDAAVMTKLIIPSLPNVKIVDVRNTQASPIIMKKLNACKNLEKLYVTRSRMRDFELEPLKSLDKLEFLCLTDNDNRHQSSQNSPLDFTQILDIKNLKELLIPYSYTPESQQQEDAYGKLLDKGVKVKIASRHDKDPSKFKVSVSYMRNLNLIESLSLAIDGGKFQKIMSSIEALIDYYDDAPTYDRLWELILEIEKVVNSTINKRDLLLAKTLAIPSKQFDDERSDRHLIALQAISDFSKKDVISEIIKYIINSKWIRPEWQKETSELNTTDHAFIFASEKTVEIGEGKSILEPLLIMSENAFSRIGEVSLELLYKINPARAVERAIEIQCGEDSSWTAEGIIRGYPSSVFDMAKDHLVSEYVREKLIRDVIRHSKEDADSVVDYLQDNIDYLMEYDLKFLLDTIESHAKWRLNDFKAAIKTRDDDF